MNKVFELSDLNPPEEEIKRLKILHEYGPNAFDPATPEQIENMMANVRKLTATIGKNFDDREAALKGKQNLAETKNDD